MEAKKFAEYRRPKFAVVELQTSEVIATSPELDITMTDYDEEEW